MTAIWLLPASLLLSSPAAPQPDSTLAACQMVQRVAGQSLRLETRIETDVDVTNEFASQPRQRRGCRVTGHTDEDGSPAPVDELAEALAAVGWHRIVEYQADGPDGSVTGLILGSTLCIVSGRWDGGDDSDTTYVPVPGYDLEVACFRRTPADARPR